MPLHCLLQPVADEALGLGDEVAERVRPAQGRVRCTLQREQPDLRSVAVHEDDLVRRRELGERPGDVCDLVDLGRRVRTLATREQRVAAERDDDAHLILRGWRP